MAEWGWWCRRCKARRHVTAKMAVPGVRDAYSCPRCSDVLVWRALPKPEPEDVPEQLGLFDP